MLKAMESTHLPKLPGGEASKLICEFIFRRTDDLVDELLDMTGLQETQTVSDRREEPRQQRTVRTLVSYRAL